jgi:predicted oxidoreductase
MQTVRIPQTDLDVSRIAYGTWHLGGTWDNTPPTAEVRERAHRLILTAVEHGINFIDLADIYTRGKSDLLVGEVLAANPGLRDRLILQEKAGIILSDLETGETGRYEFTYEHLVSALEGSLRRLNTEYVDLLLLHRPDPLVEPEEVARAFDHLHASGKVRYFGVSNHRPEQTALLRRYIRQPLVANQLELNLLHNAMIDDGVTVNIAPGAYSAAGGLLDDARLHDMQIQAWSPVAGGALFSPPPDAPANVHAAAAAVAKMAAEHATTPEAIALAWLMRHPAGVVPIIGTLRPERIAAHAAADAVTLSRIEWYRLFTAARGKPVP